jgi:uncharacterized membrane protein
MKNNQKNKNAVPKKSNDKLLGAVALLVVLIAAFTFLNPKDKGSSDVKKADSSAVPAKVENGNVVIPISDITDKAKFYSYNELDTKMEILAVKASDGTIRTAFNTCQVCYSSGRGYYIQQGDVLVCQNCGNRFKMDQVEVAKGGCNPVPIFKDSKEVTDSSIIISKDIFVEAEGIFKNWKK